MEDVGHYESAYETGDGEDGQCADGCGAESGEVNVYGSAEGADSDEGVIASCIVF